MCHGDFAGELLQDFLHCDWCAFFGLYSISWAAGSRSYITRMLWFGKNVTVTVTEIKINLKKIAALHGWGRLHA
jgi:hypothetical protein